MSGNLSLEVILSLVDHLSGPAKDAAKNLEQFGAAANRAGRGDAGLRPDKWIEEGRAIVQAADAAKKFETSTLQAAEAEKKIAGGPWIAVTGEIERATRALTLFNEQTEKLNVKPGPGAGGNGGGAHKPSGVMNFLENAGEMLAIFEGQKAVETIVGGGAHLTSEVIAQRIAGMTKDEIESARKLGLELQGQFPQFPLEQILKESREARAIFNTDDEAREALPDYLKMAALADREHPGQGLHAAYPFMRAVEEAGAASVPGKTHEMFDAFQRAKNAFGEKITAEDYQQVFQRGGAFSRQWNMHFIRDELPHLLASLGGDTTGTMIATLGMAIQGGHVMGPSLRAFDKLGLLDESKVKRKKDGEVASIEAGAIKGMDIIGRDPIEWVNKVLWPAIEKSTQDPDQRAALLTTALSNRNDLKAGYMAINDKAAFARDEKLVESPENKGLNASGLLDTDPTVGWQKLKASIESLASVSSEPLMEPIAKGLNILAGGISNLTKAAADHPNTAAAGATAAVAGITYFTGKAFGLVWNKLTGSGASGEVEAVAAEAAKTSGAGGWLAKLGLGALGLAGDALAPALWLRALGEAMNPTTPEGMPYRNDIAWPTQREDMERSRRSRLVLHPGGWTDDPEAAHGRAMHGPADAHVGNSIEDAKAKAKAAGAEIKASLDVKAAPQVDSSAIDVLIGKLREARSLLSGLGADVARAGRFAPAGGALHDGPETH